MSWRPNQDWLRRAGVFFFTMSVGRPSARDIEYRARRKRTILGSEPAYERGDLIHRHEAVHGDFREHIVDVLLGHLVEDRGLRRGGGDAVDEDAGLRKFFAQGLGKRDNPRLGRAVGDRVRVAFLPGDRGDVDDATVLALHHVRGERAAAQELAGEVDAQHALPFLDWIVDGGQVQARDAGVVDEDVDLAEVGERLCRGTLDRGRVRHVDRVLLR